MAIRSIRLLGDPVLRQEANPVKFDSELPQLIVDMIETMHNADGIGLAAPQIGCPERIFVVDLSRLMEDLSEDTRDALPPQPMVLINPEITWESESEEEFEEGCLSIPEIREPVIRPESVRITYHDQEMQKHTTTVGGVLARVIQHEYDHLDGILFTDHISAFRRTLLKRKLTEISQGHVRADYPVQSV